MKWIALVAALALAACVPDKKPDDTRYREPIGKPGVVAEKKQQKRDGPTVTFVGPRLGFDGKLRVGGISPGFSMF